MMMRFQRDTEGYFRFKKLTGYHRRTTAAHGRIKQVAAVYDRLRKSITGYSRSPDAADHRIKKKLQQERRYRIL